MSLHLVCHHPSLVFHFLFFSVRNLKVEKSFLSTSFNNLCVCVCMFAFVWVCVCANERASVWWGNSGEECGHCAFQPCVCDKQKERGREEREGDQILLQVFHKQQKGACSTPLPPLFPLLSLSLHTAALDFYISISGLGLCLCHTHTHTNHLTESVLPHYEHAMIMWQSCDTAIHSVSAFKLLLRAEQ